MVSRLVFPLRHAAFVSALAAAILPFTPATAAEDAASDVPSSLLDGVEVASPETLERLGGMIARGLLRYEFDDAEVNGIVAGFRKNLNGEEGPEDLGVLQREIQRFFQKRLQTLKDPDAAVADAEPEMLANIGWMMAQGVDRMGLTQTEGSTVFDGFKGTLSGAFDFEPTPEFEETVQRMFRSLRVRENVRVAKEAITASEERAAKQAEADAYFADLAEQEGIQRTDSGLYYEVIEAGSDDRASMADRVTVHYTGTLIDGTEFDSSRSRGTPAQFPVRGVVPGFSEGVQLVGPGGRVKIHMPAEMGYGESPRPGGAIEPGDPLVFDVELIDINGTGRQPKAPAAETGDDSGQ